MPSASFIGGTVFRDINGDGVRNAGEVGIRDVNVSIQLNRGGSPVRRTKTNSDGEYIFRDLPAGTYVVAVETPSNFTNSTPIQIEVDVDGRTGTRIANFGLLPTTVAPIVGRAAGSGGTPGRTAAGTTARATATPAPTATPSPTPTMTPIPTPTPTIPQQLAALTRLQSARCAFSGRSDDNGVITDFAGQGDAVRPDGLDLDLAINEEFLDVVVTGPQTFVRDNPEIPWTPAGLAILRRLHGVLSPLDLLNLESIADRVRTIRSGGRVQFEGQDLQLYVLELELRTLPSGDPFIEPAQFTPLAGTIELFVGPGDNLIRVARFQVELPPNRREQAGRVETAKLDVTLSCSELNSLFAISAPPEEEIARTAPAAADGGVGALPPGARDSIAAAPAQVPVFASGGEAPAPAPVRQPASGPAPAAAVSEPAVRPAPAPASVPAQTTSAQPRDESDETATEARVPASGDQGAGGASDAGSASAAALSAQRSAAADRAQQALASAAGPRAGSRIEPNAVALAVPSRPSGELSNDRFTTDGAAALAMILESFGSTARASDLQALIERLQGARSPGEAARIETLIRAAGLGSLRPLGGEEDWSAALALDYLRRGYPVLALVNSSLLPGATLDDQPSDRYIVLTGFDADGLLYRDSTVPEGSTRRVTPADLDRAWSSAIPPREGAAFAFGASQMGLFDVPSRQATAATTPARAASPSPALAAPVLLATPIPAPAEPASTEAAGGTPWLLISFIALLAVLTGFVLARLLR